MQFAHLFRGFALAPLPVLAVPLLLSLSNPLEVLELAALGYAATLLLGLLVHLILRTVGRRGLGAYVALTALATVLGSILFAASDKIIFAHVAKPNPHRLSALLNERVGPVLVIAMAICACLTAATFWFVAVRRTAAPQL